MKNLAFLLVTLSTLTFMTQAQAEKAFDLNGKTLTGDWGGKRTELAENGVKFDANIAMDSAYLADGGFDAHGSPTFATQAWLGTTLDMDKIAGWSDTTIRAAVSARQGQSTTLENIQDPAAPQWANAQANFGRGNSGSRLSELSIEKNFPEQGISVKVGRLGLGADFNVMACDFQSNAFCAAQMGKWQGKLWYNTPVSQWGGRVKFQVQPELIAQVGVYEYNPENALEHHGWNLDSKNADGVNILAETVWSPKQSFNNLPASYRLGVLYNTADEAKNQYDVAYPAGHLAEDHSYGGWISFEQQLTSTGEGRRGLHSFGNFTFHDRTTTQVDNSQQLGLKYIGLFDGQPNDILGLGVNRVHVNDRFRDSKAILNKSSEYNIELNYSYYPTSWFMLRPLVQYVVNPGATDKVDHAFVVGLGSKIIF